MSETEALQTILRVDGLKKSFTTGLRRRRVDAVRSANFSIHRNEVVGLVGPNGAGKTTTMKMITGLVNPDEGCVELFGIDTKKPESRDKLGYLPENPYFYEHLTGRELLRFYANLFGLRGREIEDRISKLIDEVGMNHAADRAIKAYSKGMRQRIGIAQALVNNPELVILDEPQSGLDPIGRREIRDIIVNLRSRGKTVVFSSHIIPDVEAVCDRIIVMKKGESLELNPSEWQAILAKKQIDCIISMPKEAQKRTSQEIQEIVERQVDVALESVAIRGEQCHLEVHNHEEAQKIVEWAVNEKLQVYGVVPKEVDFERILLKLIHDDQ